MDSIIYLFIIILYIIILTSPIWLIIIVFKLIKRIKNKKSLSKAYEKHDTENKENKEYKKGNDSILSRYGFGIKYQVKEKLIALSLTGPHGCIFDSELDKIVENNSYVDKGDLIAILRYKNFSPLPLTCDYSGVIHYNDNKIKFANIFPCSLEEKDKTIENIESINQEQKDIDEKKRIKIIEEERRQREEERMQQEEEEKIAIKEKLLERKKKRDLEKLALNELIEEGKIFPEANKRPQIPKEVVDTVWNRDGGKCVYCGSTENLHLDHIIPFSKGGATNVENLQLLCQKCNLQKSNKIG